MKFYTKSYLENLSESGTKATKTFNSSVNENKNLTSFDIFLSHSYKDKKYIRGLYLELTSNGYTVYVDWIIDPHLSRDNVTKNTVELIRKRMRQSNSLIYATSENASKSKWMPWELGYMDGFKGKCAILPITEHENSTFNGQEFLSVYPIISKNEFSYYSSDLNVQTDSNSSKEMKSWINI